ncbi:nuclear transport factor 2 family protein [Chloroflexota bacterium]
MDKNVDLKARVSALEKECRKLRDIEEIRQLKYRYWRSVHEGRWGDVGDCFAEDGIFDFGYSSEVRGRQAITDFFGKVMSKITSMAVLHGHNPEIDITSETTASGKWQLDNIRIEASSNEASRQGNAYNEEYIKEEGNWKISLSKVNYLFKQPVELEVPSNG